MIAAAFAVTSGSFADPEANVVIWGPAGAAAVAALAVLARGPALLGWIAVGYILFAALLAAARPVPLLLLLALAYMPILDRPRRSLTLGLACSAVTAAMVAILVRIV